MKRIKLTQGKYALVDDEDYKQINNYKWRTHKIKNNLYATRSIYRNGLGKLIYMHRQILNLTNNKIQADHIDNNGLNNRRKNLRVCTNQENNRNKKKINKKTSSKYKGVHYLKRDSKWIASICIDNKNYNLGHYKNEKEAGLIYDYYARKHFGKFAILNFTVKKLTKKEFEKINNKNFKTSSKYKGIYWEKHKNKWRATITYNGKRIHLGYFNNEIDAVKSRKNYIIKNKLENIYEPISKRKFI